MIGSTRSSVKRATVSCTMRSSSLSSERTSYRSTGFSGVAAIAGLRKLCGQRGSRILASRRTAVPPNGRSKFTKIGPIRPLRARAELNRMRIPVLTYHAVNIAGNDYANNDHVAFAADLRLIDDLGLRIVPVHWLVDALLGDTQRALEDCVALTCDDGTDFDFFDLDHPEHGTQRSLYNCMRDF